MDLTQYLERYAITLNAQQLEAMERIQGATLLFAVRGVERPRSSSVGWGI